VGAGDGAGDGVGDGAGDGAGAGDGVGGCGGFFFVGLLVAVVVVVVVVPPSVAMSFSDSVPMPSRSALRAATAGKAATAIANASSIGLNAGASFPLERSLWISMTISPCRQSFW
jgi:hypothetical protein